MSVKHYITFGVIIFSLLGSWLGSMLDHGNLFGIWSIMFGTVGAFAGVWAGYKLGSSL